MSAEFLSGTYSSLAPYTLWDANYGVTCPGIPAEWSTWTLLAELGQRERQRDLGRRRPRLLQRNPRPARGSHGRERRVEQRRVEQRRVEQRRVEQRWSEQRVEQRRVEQRLSSGGSSSGGGTTSPDACTEGDGFCTATLQCDSGHWIVRQDDPSACTTVDDVQEPCSQAPGYCTATLQCDGGYWVPRPDDPAACTSGPGG